MMIAGELKAQLRKYLPAGVYSRMGRWYRLLRGTKRRVPGSDVPNRLLEPPDELKYVGDGNFHATGIEFLGLFKQLAGLQPSHRVLDVGCGIGRMAIPLLEFLSRRGSYEGFDVVPRAIDWCRDNITPRNPKFRFQLADVRNLYYNPSGRHGAEEYVFPYPDKSFDLVFLTSVFTHLMPAGVANYIAEIHRVMKPGGRCFITWFTLNPESRQLIEQGRSALNFCHPLEGCETTNPAQPEAAVAYAEDRIMTLYRGAGLVLQQPIHFGFWCGRQSGLTFQDICLAERSRNLSRFERTFAANS